MDTLRRANLSVQAKQDVEPFDRTDDGSRTSRRREDRRMVMKVLRNAGDRKSKHTRSALDRQHRRAHPTRSARALKLEHQM
jgi:hypothetical protein